MNAPPGSPVPPRGPSADERLARVRLSCAGEPGHPLLTGLVAKHGGLETLEILAAGAQVDRHRRLVADLAERMPRVRPAEELEKAASRGLRFVVPGDEEWPDIIDDLEHAPLLHERGGTPVGLWCRGPLRLAEAATQAVAVVGSRSATSYGTAVAGEMAGVLARAEWTVVSGAAFGIDGAAHRGALGAEGPTVAVLACGADRAYPVAHRDLIEHLGRHHLVVSEAAPGSAPMRVRFLARNRLIAGLARGTVVVEAATRSGALNTASWTAGLGRPVMAVPGPVTSEASSGAHQLVRARDALLVTSGREVLEAVSPVGLFALADPRAPEGPRDRLTLQQRQVLDAVPRSTSAGVQSIAHAAGVERRRTVAILEELHRRGLVDRSPDQHHDRWRLASLAVAPAP